MAFVTILGFIGSILLTIGLFWSGLVLFLVAVRDEDGTAFTAWLINSAVFIFMIALTIWQPLHWAGIA